MILRRTFMQCLAMLPFMKQGKKDTLESLCEEFGFTLLHYPMKNEFLPFKWAEVRYRGMTNYVYVRVHDKPMPLREQFIVKKAETDIWTEHMKQA